VTEAIRKYNNLTQRIITGVLGAAAIITAISLSSWGYFVIFLLLCYFTLMEFYRLATFDSVTPSKPIGVVTGLLIFVLTFLQQRGEISQSFYFVIFPFIATVFIAKLYTTEKKPFTNIAFTFLGLLYIAIPLALLNFAVFENGNYHFEIILGSLLILWAADTGAYFAGTYLGKHKLFQRISPKKTWEGFFGGALLALIFAYGMSRYFDYLSLYHWLIVGVIIIVCGAFGDLVESLLKRSIAIKDSGNVLPGHGGFLDRFDGLLISSPFLVAFLELIKL
jgi:phosphatidate cytidylyltransferase